GRTPRARDVTGEPKQPPVELRPLRVALAQPADGAGGAALLATQRDDQIERLCRAQPLDARRVRALEPDDAAIGARRDVHSRGRTVEYVFDAAGPAAQLLFRQRSFGQRCE